LSSLSCFAWIVASPLILISSLFFFFNDTATTELYTLSLHDALPILAVVALAVGRRFLQAALVGGVVGRLAEDIVQVLEEHVGEVDRKSTRLNSSHLVISYAVFCLKKKISRHEFVVWLPGDDACQVLE